MSSCKSWRIRPLRSPLSSLLSSPLFTNNSLSSLLSMVAVSIEVARAVWLTAQYLACIYTTQSSPEWVTTDFQNAACDWPEPGPCPLVRAKLILTLQTMELELHYSFHNPHIRGMKMVTYIHTYRLMGHPVYLFISNHNTHYSITASQRFVRRIPIYSFLVKVRAQSSVVLCLCHARPESG